MPLPVGKIEGQLLVNTFEESIRYHINILLSTLSEYEPIDLFSNWRTLIRSIDELINIPGELSDEKMFQKYRTLNLDFTNAANIAKLKEVIEGITAQFDEKVATRFNQMALMSAATHRTYIKKNIYELQGGMLNFSSTANCMAYFQSRRIYYLTVLLLIPHVAKGSKRIPYLFMLSNLQYTLDSCMVGITTSYYMLLMNKCLPDYEMQSDGTVATGNFDFSHLEGFFMEPQTLTLMDQMELRPDMVVFRKMLPKSDKTVFSFSEVANTMTLFEEAYQRFDIKHSTQFEELNRFLLDIAIFLRDDFNFYIEESAFDEIKSQYKSLVLADENGEYFKALNTLSPFQKLNGYYFSTVVLMTRFVYRTLSRALQKNRTFQIHAGFVFEDRVSHDLSAYGFELTNITRINHKEFDVITIRNRKVYNFQCKNNYFDISSVNSDYNKIGRLNRRLCNYYERSLIKEKDREELIIQKTGIDDVEHFIISRFPVITRNKNIINYKDLRAWASV